jgi:hypothetical protein
MTHSDRTQSGDTSLTRDLLAVSRRYAGSWRGPSILAGIAVVGGLAFNWSWLIAVGVAPLLLSALPCVAMCALGLCMHRLGGRSCSTDASAPRTSQGSQVGETAANDDRRTSATPTLGKAESKTQQRWRSTDV